MSRGVNKVILIGNLGQDPETRFTPSNLFFANFTVATSESWKDKTSGDQKERTEWHRISAFGRLAEICGQYLQKGSKVYLEGQLRTRKWQDKSGNDRYTTEIVIAEMQMLDARGDNPRQAAAPHKPGHAQHPQAQAPAAPAGMDDFDDDMPF